MFRWKSIKVHFFSFTVSGFNPIFVLSKIFPSCKNNDESHFSWSYIKMVGGGDNEIFILKYMWESIENILLININKRKKSQIWTYFIDISYCKCRCHLKGFINRTIFDRSLNKIKYNALIILYFINISTISLNYSVEIWYGL